MADNVNLLWGPSSSLPNSYHKGNIYVTNDKGEVFVDVGDDARIQLGPKKTSDLVNDSGFIEQGNMPIADVNTAGVVKVDGSSITADSTGKIQVQTVTTDTLAQGVEELILSGGNA